MVTLMANIKKTLSWNLLTGDFEDVIARLCSNHDRLMEPVYSRRNMMTVFFITDSRESARGFLATVSAVQGKCISFPFSKRN